MASWTTPKTYGAGSALTASELNTYQRDNQTWIKDALTTHGITSDSTVQHVKSDYAGVSAYRSSSLTLPANTWTLVPFSDYILADNADMHTPGSGLFYAPTTAEYEVKYNGVVSYNSGDIWARVLLSHSSEFQQLRSYGAGGQGDVYGATVHGCGYVSLTAGQFINLYLYTNSSAGATLSYASFSLMQHAS